MLDFKLGLFDFKHGLLDFKHRLLDFKHGLSNFKHGLVDFKQGLLCLGDCLDLGTCSKKGMHILSRILENDLIVKF